MAVINFPAVREVRVVKSPHYSSVMQYVQCTIHYMYRVTNLFKNDNTFNKLFQTVQLGAMGPRPRVRRRLPVPAAVRPPRRPDERAHRRHVPQLAAVVRIQAPPNLIDGRQRKIICVGVANVGRVG